MWSWTGYLGEELIQETEDKLNPHSSDIAVVDASTQDLTAVSRLTATNVSMCRRLLRLKSFYGAFEIIRNDKNFLTNGHYYQAKMKE